MATALSAALKSSLFAAPSVSAARTQENRRQTARFANIRAGEEPANAQPKPDPKAATEKKPEKPAVGPKRGSMVSSFAFGGLCCGVCEETNMPLKRGVLKLVGYADAECPQMTKF